MMRSFLTLIYLCVSIALPFVFVASIHGSRDFWIASIVAVMAVLSFFLLFADRLYLWSIGAFHHNFEHLDALIRDRRYQSLNIKWPQIWLSQDPLFKSPKIVGGLIGPVKVVLGLGDWHELSEEKLVEYCLRGQARRLGKLRAALMSLNEWINSEIIKFEAKDSWSYWSSIRYLVFFFFRRLY